MLTKRLRLILSAATLALLTAASLAHAQSPLGIGTAEPSFQPTGGPLAPLLLYVNYEQQAFYRALTGALKAMRQDPWQLASLIGLSFAYGVFHAAGPGHGKAVISSYMIANEIELKRGVVISFISAFVQGVVAVALVGGAWLVLRGTGITLTAATHAMEIASFVMVILFGGWLLFRKLRSMVGNIPRRRLMATPAGPVSMMLDWKDNAAERQAYAFNGKAQAVEAGHTFVPGMVCETCGNAHVPDPALLGGDRFSVREAWSAIVAVGLRPCSGALLVMTFSLLNGLYLGGVLSVAAMSLGTAITVSLLATLAVTAKSAAVRLSGRGSTASIWVGNAIEILGAVLVMLMGALLLGASLQG
ncbi:delayed-early response protein/equilibrative nucleoside transporter [Rhizobium leguminosarum bv. viciae]|uniref:nickel/cobalt transporter n=1 Tax=Rhizobium ruizarguesonis TaxID=2081791 RepID=UPI00103273BE|nr:nickel/cobalt transporter [Rhizobium ruizarguesonis]NKJ76310.1 delayed-early response protein/equilibrative nucleoside transporter [Rhizobium leguminosarum bv. viciae]MBC2805622.1 nickel/cobalt transporter [Rhizobium ruizarguesonis]NKL42488.1 delayed-early response protein/equilibrative nucleoside transporter [Rhizobium leguminosarum bv. viciae]NKQ70132.1 delayed-early response protein/equilibrative nucleoside transporter [Rhizobium ruizarguesonis]NKQ76531.1 delayed-early response protein/e